MTPTIVYARTEGEKFSADHELVAVTCVTCHMLYAIPQSLQRAAVKYPGDDSVGWKLCCPLGHTWWYVGESDADKLKRERARAGRLAADLDQAIAERTGARAAATRARNERDRLKRRAAAGVCPCCGRSFKQLRRHMASQHPGFAEDGS